MRDKIIKTELYMSQETQISFRDLATTRWFPVCQRKSQNSRIFGIVRQIGILKIIGILEIFGILEN